MSDITSASNQFITVKNVTIAYRIHGSKTGIPLVHIPGFRATMDCEDPLFIKHLARKRQVILFDGPGVGGSGGQIPGSPKESAEYVAEFVETLGFRRVDIWAFSMGGCTAQMVALNHPDLVHHLILCGSLPSIGPGITPPPPAPFRAYRNAATFEEQERAFIEWCFPSSKEGQLAAEAAWQRALNQGRGVSAFVDVEGGRRQFAAFARFMKPEHAADGSFNRLHELKMPVLILRGIHDYVFTETICNIMVTKICRTAVVVGEFLGAGYACYYQFPEEAARLVNEFLNNCILGETDNISLSKSKEVLLAKI